MIQDIATSIGEFDVSDEDYLFMKEFVAICGTMTLVTTVLYSYVMHWLCRRGSVFWKRDL